MTLYNTGGKSQSGEERFGHIIGLLKDATVNHHTAKACCPAHDDDMPSLEVKLHSDDKISLKCYKGCDYRDILASINIKPVFLYPPTRQRHSQKQSSAQSNKKRIVAVYQYKKLNGHPAYQSVRFEPKDFRMRQDEKTWSMKDVTMVPYNLPEISKAISKGEQILFVEGEKDADNGMKLGFPTTTVAGGNGKWRDEYAQYFKDADLIFLPDNDEAGISGALRIAKKLRNIARRIRFLTLPVDLKGDLSDWIKAGGDKRQLRELIFLEGTFLDEALLAYKLNKKHAVIMVQGKLAVMNEEYSPAFNRNEITLSTTDHFQGRYDNKKTIITRWKKDTKDDEGKKAKKINELTKFGKIIPKELTMGYSAKNKMLPDGKTWIESPQRRQYNGFFFDPDKPNEVKKYYNLWRGFGVKEKEGNCSLFYRHIFEVLANNDEKIAEYIMDWMADALQNLTKRPGVALAMRGGQAAGKGTFANIFGHLYGQHYMEVSDVKHVVGSFNAHLKDCLMLFTDEAFFAGDKKQASILKNLITDPTRPVEFKGKDVLSMKNYTRVIMASNQQWIAPLDKDDRRFFVIDVSDKHKKNPPYFKALYRQMEKEGGYEALLHDLLQRDISKVEIRDFPVTQAIIDNKLESLDTIGQWVYENLMSGELYEMATVEEVNIKQMYHRYKESCGKSWPVSTNGWRREMRKFFPHVQTRQKYTEGGRHYVFESLEKCRQEFEERMHAKIDWNE